LNERDVEILRTVVREHLVESHRETVDEFDVSFPAIIEGMRTKIEIADPLEAGSRDDLGFDASILVGTLISTACWIGLALLRAAFKDSIERDLVPRLDAAQEMLIRWSGKPELVRALRARIEGILKKL